MTRTVWKCDACGYTKCALISMTSEELCADAPRQCPYCADDIVEFKKFSECEVPEDDAPDTNVSGKEEENGQ